MIKTGSEEFSLERAVSNDEKDAAVRVSLFQTDLVREKIRKVLPIFDRKGLLDEM